MSAPGSLARSLDFVPAVRVNGFFVSQTTYPREEAQKSRSTSDITAMVAIPVLTTPIEHRIPTPPPVEIGPLEKGAIPINNSASPSNTKVAGADIPPADQLPVGKPTKIRILQVGLFEMELPPK